MIDSLPIDIVSVIISYLYIPKNIEKNAYDNESGSNLIMYSNTINCLMQLQYISKKIHRELYKTVNKLILRSFEYTQLSAYRDAMCSMSYKINFIRQQFDSNESAHQRFRCYAINVNGTRCKRRRQYRHNRGQCINLCCTFHYNRNKNAAKSFAAKPFNYNGIAPATFIYPNPV
jgi:hypothetical protein